MWGLLIKCDWLIDYILLKNERYMQMDMYIMIIFMTIWKYVPYASFLGIGSCWWNMLCLIVMFIHVYSPWGRLFANKLSVSVLFNKCIQDAREFFHSYGELTILLVKGCKSLAYTRRLRPLSRKFIVPHLLGHRATLFFSV